jgi:hypothetical protein
MATEILHFSALDENNDVTWTGADNVIGSFGVNAANTSVLDTQEQYGGGNLEDVSFVPISIDSFIVSSYDATGAHGSDLIKLELYNPDTSAWTLLDSWTSGGSLPEDPTEVDYTTSITTMFDLATDKEAFINGLKLRWRLESIVKVSNDASVYTQGCELVLNSATTWSKSSPTDATWKKTG